MKTEEIRILGPLFTYYHCIHANFSYSEEQMQHVLLRAYGGWDRNSIIVVMLVRETLVKFRLADEKTASATFEPIDRPFAPPPPPGPPKNKIIIKGKLQKYIYMCILIPLGF